MNAVTLTSSFPATVQPGIPKLGTLPDGWTRAPLGQFLKEVRRPLKMVDNEEYRLVTVKRARGGVIDRGRFLGKDVLVKSQFLIEPGDFLISKRQIVHGACGLVPQDLGGSIVSNEYSVLNGTEDIDLTFLNFLAHSIFFQQTCFHSSIGVHVEKMIFKLDRWLGFEFDLPPLPEQRKIADILSTWDRAIEATEALLATARTRKRALMQSLLTGKRRFPEFEGQEWKEVRLGDVTQIIVSNVDKKSDPTQPPVRLCNYTDVYKWDTIDPSQNFMEATATPAQIKRFGLQFGDVVITKDSETADDIAMPTYVAETADDLVCGYHLAIVRPGGDADGRFLKFYFDLPHTRYYFGTRANGAIRFGLTIDGIVGAKVQLPSIEEQGRIATVIAATEREISQINTAIEKLRTEKKALMQQLLTGKRRVVV